MAKITTAEVGVELTATTGQFTTAFQQAQKTVRETKESVEKTVSGFSYLGAAFAAVGVAAAGIAGAIGAVKTAMNFAEQGKGLNDLSTQFQILATQSGKNYVTFLSELKTATDGALTNAELMAVANKGMSLGLEQAGISITELVKNVDQYADAIGIDGKQAINTFVSALGSGRVAALQSMGITIDLEKATADYAATLGKSVKDLSNSEKAAAKKLGAMQALRDAVSRLGDAERGAGAAAESLNTTMQDASDSFGAGFDSSAKFRDALDSINQSISQIDFKQLGKDIADIVAILANGVNVLISFGKGLSVLTTGLDDSVINDYAKLAETTNAGINSVDQLGRRLQVTTKDLANATSEMEKQEKIIAAIDKKDRFRLWDSNTIGRAAAAEKWEEAKLKVELYKKEIEILGTRMNQVAISNEIAGNKNIAVEKESTKAIEERTDAINDLADSYGNLQRKTKEDSIQDSISQALEKGDFGSLTALKKQLYEATYDSVLEGKKEAIKKAGPEGEKLARAEADLAAKLRVQAIEEKEKPARLEMAKQEVQAWRDLLQNGINGLKFDFADMAQRIGVGFAASAGNSIFGSLGEGVKSAEDLGQKIFDGLFGDTKDGGGKIITDIFEPLLNGDLGIAFDSFSKQFDSVFGAAAIQNAVSNISQLGKSTEATIGGLKELVGAGVGGLLGSLVGAPGAGAAIGGQLGGAISDGLMKELSRVSTILNPLLLGPFAALTGDFGNLMDDLFGGNNVDSQGRNAVTDFLNDALAQVEGFTTVNGTLLNRIMFDENQFDRADWPAKFQEIAGSGQAAFEGLGLALTSFAGVNAELAPQIGFILAQNLNGNLDNARMLVKEIGLDAGTMEAALVKAAENGSITWHQMEVAMQNMNVVFGEGVVAVGAVDQTLVALRESGGRGVKAIESVRNMAIEAIEAGAQSLSDLEAHLRASGELTENEIAAVMQSLSQRGIKSLEQLKNASSRELGGIVADLESLGFGFADISEDATKAAGEVEKLGKNLDRLPDKVDVGINVKVKVTGDPLPDQIKDPTSGIRSIRDVPADINDSIASVQNATSSRSLRTNLSTASMPSVSNNMANTFIINAQGAMRGVAEEIQQALREFIDSQNGRVGGFI